MATMAITSHTQNLLEQCSDVDQLKQLHARICKTGLGPDSIPFSRLVALCASPTIGDLAYARMLFREISRPNVFTWNAMIRGYSNNNQPEQAFLLYGQMMCDSALHNSYTFPLLLRACSNLPSLEGTKQIHTRVVKTGFSSNVFTLNSLIHAYATFGQIGLARHLFDAAPLRDMVSWNSMIDGYAKCGEMGEAYELFRDAPEKNVVSWTTVITGFVRAGMDEEALDLFQEMLTAGVKPDNLALVSSLSACAHLGAMDQGRWIHTYIDRKGFEIDLELDCALIDMYAKCGHMEEALAIFAKSEKKSIASWTAVISGFAIHGQAREAMELYMKMQKAKLRPNSITLTAILSACSHSGLVSEGRSIFNSIKSVHNLDPVIEHYGCLVDLFCRAGLLKEAEELIEAMPLEPNAAILGALLNACRIHGNIELGKEVGKILIDVDPTHSGRFIQAANIFASRGEWGEAVTVRRKMNEIGLTKLPGCSRITIDGTVHHFFAGDGSHPRINEIHEMWDKAAERLRREGYRPVIGNLLLDLEDDEKEIAIQQHSEKLAIAFGLISSKPGMAIRIFKNLRTCEDCHTVAKIVSKIYSREIVMRDRTRFHVFRDGNCTCGDYW